MKGEPNQNLVDRLAQPFMSFWGLNSADFGLNQQSNNTKQHIDNAYNDEAMGQNGVSLVL